MSGVFDLAEFREVFSKFDQDGSGFVDVGELKMLFVELGLLEPDDDDLVILVLEHAEFLFQDGGEGDDALSYTEFLLYCRKFWEWSEGQAKNAAAASKKFSSGADGAPEGGGGGRKSFFQNMQSGQSKVKVLFQRYLKHLERERERAAEKEIDANMDRECAVRDMFHKYDVDHSGDMNVGELKSLLLDLKILKDDEDLEANVIKIMEEAEDKVEDWTDYKLSFSEFVHVYNHVIDVVKGDSKRLAKHFAKLKTFSEALMNGSMDEATEFLSEHVVIDQPTDWAGFGGATGQEKVVKVLTQNKKDVKDLVFNLDFEQTGSYTKTDPTMQREVYVYRQSFVFTNEVKVEGSYDPAMVETYGHLLMCVEQGINTISELIYFVHAADED